MSIDVLFVLTAAVDSILGLFFVALPGPAVSLFGVSPDPSLNALARLFGGSMITFALLVWGLRGTPDSPARRAVVSALFIGNVLAAIIQLAAALQGIYNLLGWVTSAAYLIFGLAYGYFHWTTRSPSA